MKRILFYTDTPNIGGAEKQMLVLAKHLSRKGFEVDLAYGKYSKIYKMHDDFSKYCKLVHVLPAIHKHDPRHYTSLKKLMKSGKYDLLHIHLWNPGSCRYAFFAASHLNIPIITTEHDPFELTGLKRQIKKNCLKKTAQTIVISQDNLRLLGEYYEVPKERLKLVHNGIELDRFLDSTKCDNLPVQSGEIVITCIAELHPRKGHKYLLRAFMKLQEEMPQIKTSLLLVGEGPLENEFKEQYFEQKNIHFLGWRNDIPEILKSSDIFVLPSLKEAFGLVLVEAMASGVPVITTNTGGAVDIVQDGKTGYLVPPSNSEKITEAIRLILQNEEQKKDIIASALESAKQNFTADKMTDNTIDVYMNK
ncbi:glycosyltransferase family 4 protein [Candidatus Peregrinibacteria bacterium]|nr:glycosyltransferase family 4 protein [Candidatus Peregrinibacteria bacterium]